MEAGDEHESTSGGARVSDEVCYGAILSSCSPASSIGCLDEILCSEEATAREHCLLHPELAAIPSFFPEINEKPGIESGELCNGAQTGVLLELNRSNAVSAKDSSSVTVEVDQKDPTTSGRIIDTSSGPSRGDRCMTHIHENSSTTCRPAQGVYNGVLRNRSMPSLSSQGAMGRNSSDLRRWQRPNGIQRGIMPPPQRPTQVIHKFANKYEIGRASDEEEMKQRRVKAILNELSHQNFDKLLNQMKEVNIDKIITVTGLVSQIDKALMEPNFCEIYDDFCLHLATELPGFLEESQKLTNFTRLLLNKCREEFEGVEREHGDANIADEGVEIQQIEGEREEKRIQAHRRMLGNIRLIGELCKKKKLTERIMHACMKTLLGQYQNPDEENIEALCKVLSTIGEMIDPSDFRKQMDSYFDKITMLSTNQKMGTIDLRKNKWSLRRKVEGPKKIEEVHGDVAQERQAQTSKVGWGPNISSRRRPPADYARRESTVLDSTSSQMSRGSRHLLGNARGPGRQDARRHQFESR